MLYTLQGVKLLRKGNAQEFASRDPSRSISAEYESWPRSGFVRGLLTSEQPRMTSAAALQHVYVCYYYY